MIAFLVLAATIATPALQQVANQLGESLEERLSSSAPVAPGDIPAGLSAAEWADIQSQIAALQASPPLDPQVTVEPVVAPTQRLGRFATATYATAGATFSFDDHTVRLATVSVGGPVTAVAPESSGDRVIYDRGPVREWFIETDRGIEQGWTIAEAPAGAADELVIEVATATSLIPMPLSSQAIGFLDTDGTMVAQYAGLVAWDADGVDLAAVMDVEADRIEITVDVTDATYPITVDPTFSETQALFPGGNTAQNRTGSAIDVDMNASGGPVAVIAVPGGDRFGNDLGSVIVARFSGGTWSIEARLGPIPAAGPTAEDDYAASVAVFDDRIAVGAPGKADNGPESGLVHVYDFDGSAWQPGSLLAECGAAQGTPCGDATGRPLVFLSKIFLCAGRWPRLRTAWSGFRLPFCWWFRWWC